MIQTSLFEQAEQRRDRGIKRGLTHAEQERLGWRLKALQVLGHFLSERRELPFLTEAFRMYARTKFVADPPDARAWGAVMRAAQKEGMIESCGAERALTSNLSYKVLWKRKS